MFCSACDQLICYVSNRQDTQDTESSSGFVDVDEDDIIEKISDDDNLSDWSDGKHVFICLRYVHCSS